MFPQRNRLKWLIWFFLFSLTACGLYQKGGTYVWIDVPINGLNLPDIQPVKINGHASSPGGIQRVEISIDDALFTVIENPSLVDNLAAFEVLWVPSEEGEHLIQALAYGNNGAASEIDTARITFGGIDQEATLIPTHTQPTPEPSHTLTATLDTGTQSPTSTSTSTQTPPDPTTMVSPTATATPTSTITPTQTVLPDTPTPTITSTPPDTTPPPVPSPMVPADGLSLSCRSTQSLAWLPVTDPSGIAEYQVEIQHSSDATNWAGTSESPLVGLIDKTTPVETDCGWYYRWRVHAVDGEGNQSDWSAWSYFTINLE